MTAEALSIQLPNVGPGPDPVSVADLGSASSFVVLLLMQSHRRGTCRQQAREVAADYHSFQARATTVAAIVPGTHPKVRSWRRLVDPPFPILADDEDVVRDAFGQPTQYGTLGRIAGSIGRVPMTVVLDCRHDEPSVSSTYEGTTSFDRPSVRELLAAIDEL